MALIAANLLRARDGFDGSRLVGKKKKVVQTDVLYEHGSGWVSSKTPERVIKV